MTDSLTSAEATVPETETTSAGGRRKLLTRAGRMTGLIVVVVIAVDAVIALALGAGGSGGGPGPATGAAVIVPADALACVNVSLGRRRPAVHRALVLARRFPDYPLAYAAMITRLGAILAGGRSVDFARQVRPWLGNEAALALLNTPTSTAGSLMLLAVTAPARARAFVRSAGAVGRGSYRGTALLAYPGGSELAVLHGFMVLGQDASVRAAIDVASGATPSLSSASAYSRAAAGEPADRVLDAYASAAGVRRLLAPQGGIIGALGDLLYQPALQGVTVALSPSAGGARIHVHSALDPTLERLSGPAGTAFTPSLQNVMPTGSILMFDVTGLDRVAPHVLNAGSAAGVAGGIGPLLTRLGGALRSEGVNVQDIVSIFHGETAVAIVPHAQAPALVIVARARDQARITTELAQLQIPLAQLFTPPAGGAGAVPKFSDRPMAGITAHQLTLANGLELDYAVSGGLVMISTSLEGIAAVVQRAHTLARDPSFRFVLGRAPQRLTSLVFLDFGRLLALGVQTGLTSSGRFQALRADLEKIQAVGLSSTHAPGQSSASLTIRIP